MMISKESPNVKSIAGSPPWQRNLVLLSKNVKVWLAQLSKLYQREIFTLDQIPDEELENLSKVGISGLWLVGIWERSPASKKIKHLYGNDHLIASAYSIYQYSVAQELGGEAALDRFLSKAQKFNLNLACDMVPNHTAIDSPWLIDNPQWYMTTRIKPRDTWKFTSPNLSTDPSVEIRLEDGYYTQTSAAEVFQLIRESGSDPLYVFHGNDGTSMPWNDTAQLNHLNSETRAALKSEIIKAAKKFRIIRLDAAMTLLKQHYKRLWYPDEGADRNIPTRIANVLTQTEFDALMPNEFWLEILDALSKESPDTLIMAEAFWMMEKYFIQSLGMHRVYNSAFLNNLKEENNAQFRIYMQDIIKNNRYMLERFVNYLTTPDEESAAVAFGKGKKYLAICGLMSVFPGLPLFGHGQFEGFSEKYAMDYGKPFTDENPDQELINAHNHWISPLLHTRERFVSAENFSMLDFLDDDNKFNENVLVFLNIVDNKTTLIILNNQNKNANGWVPGIFAKLTERSKNSPCEIRWNDQNQILFTEIRTKNQFRISGETLRLKGGSFSLSPYDFFVFDINYRGD